MNRIIKAGIFGGLARVAFIDITEMAEEERKIHNLSPLATAALGRAMTMGAYIMSDLKEKENVFSATFAGNGVLGPIVVAGGNGTLRGYVTNPDVELPLKADGHLDVGNGVGKQGFLTVVKDIGLRDPYVGRCELDTGEIAEDFVKYMYVSEGRKSSVAFGVRVNRDGVVSAGGIVAEAMPGITEDMIVILSDVMSNFANFSAILEEKTLDEIYSFYFSHLDGEIYGEEYPIIKCSCSQERMDNIIRGFGREEAEEILRENGKIEAICHFCEKKYTYESEDVRKLWTT